MKTTLVLSALFSLTFAVPTLHAQSLSPQTSDPAPASPGRLTGFSRTNSIGQATPIMPNPRLGVAARSAAAVMPYGAAVSSRGPVQVIQRGLDYRVCQQTVTLTNQAGFATNRFGGCIVRTNHWTELATGMHARQPDGSWGPADDEIVLTSEGAAATKSQHQVSSPQISRRPERSA